MAGVSAPAQTLLAVPLAFASTKTLTDAELRAIPSRAPRPSRLAQPLALDSPKVAEALRTLGVQTAGDLIWHLPSRMRSARTVEALQIGEQATIAVEVQEISCRGAGRRRGRALTLVEAIVRDETGAMNVTFFNQPWLVKRYRPGTQLLLHGTLRPRRGFAVAHHALASEAAAEATGWVGAGTGEVSAVAHYPATEGVSSTQILTLVQSASRAIEDVPEPLPSKLLASEGLAGRQAALRAMHFPHNPDEHEQGRRRLAFEELLLSQLSLRRRRALHAKAAAHAIDGPRQLTQRWLAHSLPFAPTSDQEAAMARIDADIASPHPMQRLLMGEVGSGKTVVALYAMLRAVEHGLQAALMAPTETLAEQHFATLQALAPDGTLVASQLLTGSTPARRRKDALGKLATGQLQLLVGTHALIEQDVRFASLGVVVVDEQHRFGVRQRTALAERAPAPHVLHMTATPIPRTLALTRYGDLDVTRLRELPSGRQPIATHLASSAAERARAYERIREELSRGRQAFVVCPLVSESEQLQAKAATAEFERLCRGELKDFELALLHGQMRPKEKQAAMLAFAAGEADVLVATTVIEVGIDVPNATVMLIEDAERYGISQLHQLRGRVGRGSHPSLCLLFGPKDSRRLQALAEHENGFQLAEIDLRLRGEGDLQDTGVSMRQSGFSELRVARLPEDEELLLAASRWASELIDGDPDLAQPEHALLDDALSPVPA